MTPRSIPIVAGICDVGGARRAEFDAMASSSLHRGDIGTSAVLEGALSDERLSLKATSVVRVVPPAGIEPAASGLGIPRSIQLS